MYLQCILSSHVVGVSSVSFCNQSPVWSQVLEIGVRPLKAFPPSLFTLVSISQRSIHGDTQIVFHVFIYLD